MATHSARQMFRGARLVALILMLLVAAVPQRALAFDRNDLIDDYVFDQSGTMNAGQIDAFLNSKPYSCISPNSGFDAKLPTGYSPSGGFAFGGFVTAGRVIEAAAQAYDLNPRVILVIMEREQNLVTGRSSPTYCNNSDHKYAAAMGYGCLDGGSTYAWSGVSLYRRNGVERTEVGSTCVSSLRKVGFSQQVIIAAWKLKFAQQRALGNVGWAIVRGSWDNSDDLSSCYGGPMTQGNYRTCPGGPITYFDGYRTIDGVAVHMDNGATASLYWYTPHFHGNENFVSLFTSYFGGTTGPMYAWRSESVAMYSDSGYTQQISNPDHTVYLAPGQKIYIRYKARNTGRYEWNKGPFRLALSGPRSRSSPFKNNDWISNDRVATIKETLVKTNEVATFDFSLTAPPARDFFYERFSLVYDGVSWATGFELWLPITVTNSTAPPGSAAPERLTQTANTLSTGRHILSTDLLSALTLLPDGNLVLYRDHRTVWSSGTGGTGANRLVMQGDGNLVLYKPNNQPVWASNTNGVGATSYALIQNDGNLVVYNNSGAQWATNTQRGGDPSLRAVSVMDNGERLLTEQALITPNRQFRLVMQGDGNLVLYGPGGVVWATGTNGSGAYRAYMQPDGNLVLYRLDGRPVWASGTNGNGTGVRLVLQNDRNIVLYRHSTPVWSSNTRL